MGNIFRNIYSWFGTMYGDNLYQFLKGADCNYDISYTNHFLAIGLATLAIVGLIIALYYFLPRGRFNRLGSWFITMGIAAILCFAYGFGTTYSKYDNMPAYWIYGPNNVEAEIDPNTGEATCNDCDCLNPIDGAVEQVDNINFLYFGFANSIISIGLFIILSFIVKRFSTPAQHTPWKSLFPKR